LVGTWGVAVFADDLAADVRGDWRDAILEGLGPQEATARIMDSFADALTDDDDLRILWIALAASQSKTGRPLPEVRDRALAIIDAGADIERWLVAKTARLCRRNRLKVC
jgi:hypothetical protein